MIPKQFSGWMIINTRIISSQTINEVYEVIINYQQPNGDLIIRFLYHFDRKSLEKYNCQRYKQFLP